MTTLLTNITLIGLAIFIGFYIMYYLLCHLSLKKKNCIRPCTFPKESLPIVSVIVPVYNESKVIPTRFENFKQWNYPKNKLDIVFVDSGSVDGTAGLIDQYSKKVGFSVQLVQQGSRKGFNSAVIDGFAKTTGDIIIITGAETEFDPDALHLLVDHFADNKIGAVNGCQRIKNVADGPSPRVEVAYRNIYDFIREAESCIDSPFDIKGEIAAARRCIIQNLVDNPEMRHKGCIDACVSFQGKLDGYKTNYDGNAVYYELSPRSMRDSFKQQIRRAATLIENMWVFKKLILNRKYGAFGMVIMPAHFLMLVILPFLFLGITVATFILILLNPSNLLFPILGVFGLIGLAFSRSVQAFVKTQVALLLATLKLLFGAETQKFERLDSARPANSQKK